MSKLVNIVLNHRFSILGCARQNLSQKCLSPTKILPKYNWYGTKSASLFFLSLWTKGGWVSGAIGDPSNLLPNCSKDLLSHRHHFLQLHLGHQGPAVDPGEYSSEGAEGSKLDKGQLILHHHHWEVVVMVEEEVIKVSRNNAKPLTPCNFALL